MAGDSRTINWDKEKMLLIMQDDLLMGVFKQDMLQRLREDHYGWGSDSWSRAKQYEYIKDAYDGVKIEIAENREVEKQAMYGRYMTVYNKCMKKGKEKEAINALDSVSKLMGLNEPDKIENRALIEINFTVDGVLNE